MLVPVVDYEELYGVTEDGKVFGHSANRWLKLVCGSHGYFQCRLCCAGVVKTHTVHRLIAQAFLPNPFNLPQINHKNGVRTHNHASNLEWCDSKQNSHHARDVLGKHGGRAMRPVLGIHIKSGIRLYMPSMAEAARFVNGSHVNIRHACQGKQSQAYGYRWNYVDSVVS